MLSPARVDPLSAAAVGFEERYRHRPSGVWSAPGRANLIGEHTDYNGGFVLPFAIDRRTAVALSPRTDGVIRLASPMSPEVVEARLADLGPERIDGWSAYPLGTVWALGEVGARERSGFDAYIASDVPLGAGLSSSAAITCALALALDDTWEAALDRRALVRATQLAENVVVGAPTGILDQSAALLCEPDSALFLDCRDGSSESVPLRLREAGLQVLVIDTRVSHAHSTGGYADRRAACESAAATLGVAALRDVAVGDLRRAANALDPTTYRRVRHVVTENQRVLDAVARLRDAGPTALGDLLVASHASMRDDFAITVPEVDAAVEAAMAAGAVGARMTGGGFGGSVIALIRTEEVEQVSATVLEEFAARGFETPGLLTVTPSQGARRDR